MNFAQMLLSATPIKPVSQSSSSVKHQKMQQASVAARRKRMDERWRNAFAGRTLTTVEVADALDMQFVRGSLYRMLAEGRVELIGYKPNSTGKRPVAIWRWKE